MCQYFQLLRLFTWLCLYFDDIITTRKSNAVKFEVESLENQSHAVFPSNGTA